MTDRPDWRATLEAGFKRDLELARDLDQAVVEVLRRHGAEHDGRPRLARALGVYTAFEIARTQADIDAGQMPADALAAHELDTMGDHYLDGLDDVRAQFTAGGNTTLERAIDWLDARHDGPDDDLLDPDLLAEEDDLLPDDLDGEPDPLDPGPRLHPGLLDDPEAPGPDTPELLAFDDALLDELGRDTAEIAIAMIRQVCNVPDNAPAERHPAGLTLLLADDAQDDPHAFTLRLSGVTVNEPEATGVVVTALNQIMIALTGAAYGTATAHLGRTSPLDARELVTACALLPHILTQNLIATGSDPDLEGHLSAVLAAAGREIPQTARFLRTRGPTQHN